MIVEADSRTLEGVRFERIDVLQICQHSSKRLSNQLRCWEASYPYLFEASNRARRHNHTLAEQESPLGEQVAAVAAQLAAGGDYAVARHGGVAAGAHDVADGSCRARTAGGLGDVAIGSDAAAWNAAHRREHLSFETSPNHTPSNILPITCLTLFRW